tara:strand:+ start:3128 stop:3619 length:492 start_codon:yes stop_codon:yes gene_type:complete
LYKLELLQKPFSDSDLNQIWSINQENIPEVGDVADLDRLNQLINWSSHVLVVREHEIAGFIILMRENENYDSLNYHFFNSQNNPFLYVDRIAIKEGHRRQGLGKMIYEKTIEIANDLNIPTCCEVNTIPRNDPSLAFHDSFGFVEVGTKDYDDHSVVYLKKSS